MFLLSVQNKISKVKKQCTDVCTKRVRNNNNSGKVESLEEHWPSSKYAGLWTRQFRVQVHVEVCVLLSCARHFIPTMPLLTTQYKSLLTIYLAT